MFSILQMTWVKRKFSRLSSRHPWNSICVIYAIVPKEGCQGPFPECFFRSRPHFKNTLLS